MSKILLVGYMGAGKSVVGKQLADSLDIPFFDLDDVIENDTKTTVPELFASKGEMYFRKLEHEKLKELLHSEGDFVLSLGGGTPCYANNHLLLQGSGVISIYLQATVATLAARLRAEVKKRPLLANIENLEGFVGQHVLERAFYYKHAVYQVKTDNKNIADILKEIRVFLT